MMTTTAVLFESFTVLVLLAVWLGGVRWLGRRDVVLLVVGSTAWLGYVAGPRDVERRSRCRR